MQTKSGVSFMLALALATALPAAATAQSTAPAAASTSDQGQITQPERGVNWQGVGVGAGTLATNLVYIPAKLVYGVLGGIAGGAGYALTGGNEKVANTIWRSSLGGDYVVTPDMLTGQQPVHFSGPTETDPGTSSAVNSGTHGMNASPSSYTSTTSSAGSNASSGTPPTAAHPIDSGAGPIGVSTLTSSPIDSSGSGSIGSHSTSYGSAPAPAKSVSGTKRAPDTSIE
jgi:hypothetical protein